MTHWRLKLSVTMVLAVLTFDSFATGGRTGNAGDWRRIMLTAAQRESANWTNTASLNLDLFAQVDEFNSDELVAAFVSYPDALKLLAHDIVSSRHIYIGDQDGPSPYTTCAWTNDPTAASMTDITLTLALCEGGLTAGGQAFANRLLIHESVHHLLKQRVFADLIGSKFTGTAAEKDAQEEVFCDRVAAAIEKVFELVAQLNKPHWRDIAVPWFDLPDGKAQVLEARGFHAGLWTGPTGSQKTANKMLIWGGCREGNLTIYACGGDAYYDDGALYDPATDSWSLTSKDHAPSPRAQALALWTGSTTDSVAGAAKNRMIIWGGCRGGDGCTERLNDGGIYDPLTDSWDGIARSDLVAPRVHHGGVWTGSELIVWGGHPTPDPQSIYLPDPLGDGGIYSPASGWTHIPAGSADAPEPRAFPLTIWTGETGNDTSAHKMLVWGGCEKEVGDSCARPLNNGAWFDPETKSWQPLRTTGPVPSGRHHYSALYVESQANLYIFGGLDRHGNVLNDGYILNLKTLTWTPLASTSVGRFKHRAVWAGDKMMIFGGKHYNSATRSYDLAASVTAFVPSSLPGNRGRWLSYQTEELTPLLTIEHTALWTGDSLLVWGGQIFERGFTNVGSRFFTGTAR